MRFRDWIDQQDAKNPAKRGTLAALARGVGKRYATLHNYYSGRVTCDSVRMATLISQWTMARCGCRRCRASDPCRRSVSVVEMCESASDTVQRTAAA